MNFSQLQERLRVELLRRIDRGSVNGALLARQTGFQPSHISNFLRRRRTLSLDALDRLLAAQLLTVEDLLAAEELPHARAAPPGTTHTPIPLVTLAAAIHDPTPPPSPTIDVVQLPLVLLEQVRPRRSSTRRSWTRFVAVRVTRQQATGMQPVLPEHSLAVIDRHYNSLIDYRPPSPSIFAVRVGNTLQLRFASFEHNRVVLRPIELEHPVELVTLGPHEMPSDVIVGRVCLTLAPLP